METLCAFLCLDAETLCFRAETLLLLGLNALLRYADRHPLTQPIEHGRDLGLGVARGLLAALVLVAVVPVGIVR